MSSQKPARRMFSPLSLTQSERGEQSGLEVMCSYFPMGLQGFPFFYSKLPDNTVCEPYILFAH